MPFKPLVTAGIETALNTFLWRDKALKPARQRLLGKVLRVELKSCRRRWCWSSANVRWMCWAWEGEADCTVITRLSVLPQLRNRQQLTALIRSGDLEVQGDLQVVQNTVALCDLAEFDPAELLAPYTGDIVAEGVSKVFRGGARFLLHGAQRQQRYVAEAMTEEWRMAPGPLELAWFAKKPRLLNALSALEKRLETLEGK
jgi:ubiquinone biosynthesis protein UbiJ